MTLSSTATEVTLNANNPTYGTSVGQVVSLEWSTTNKLAFAWASSQSEKVLWQRQARWVEDGKFFTSSGVSAGIDLSLAVIARLVSDRAAEQAANFAEYSWNRDADRDPFAELHGLVGG